MEINITWNVCRICLQEQNTMHACTSAEINTDMAKQILEMTGVMIKTNDLLPQKICKKCLHVLKQAVHFCETCRCSDTYLQSILEKAKSATSFFKTDKPNKNVFDDIIEEPTEDMFGEEHLLEECDSESKRKNDCMDYAELEPTEKKRKEDTTMAVDDIEKESIAVGIDGECDKQTITPTVATVETENDLLSSKPPEEAISKSSMDFGSMFLNNESDLEPDDLSDPKDTAHVVDFSRSISENTESAIDNHVENSSFLQYKTLEVTLDNAEEDVQDEMLQSSNLSTVDIISNDANEELFFIFSDDVISKTGENETPDPIKGDTILVENMANMVDNMVNDSDEERNFDELVDSESNTLDHIDCIDEEFIKTDEEFTKTDGMSRETTPNNENENFYEQVDLIERSLVQYKPHYIQQRIDDYDKSEDDCYIIKPTQTKTTNYFCQICGNQFNSRSSLKHHMRIHRNERNYECELCGKRFTAACNLTTHMRTHTGEKPFVCRYCQRRFSDKSTHVKHERSHTDERPYSCTVCQKAFTLSSSLKAHYKVHTGEKPFSCITCGKSFKLPHQLKAHMSTNAHKIRTEEEFITPN